MHLLITRPESEARAFAADLEALGHTVTSEPLLSVELLPIAPDALQGAGAIIATSRNGLGALAASPAIEGTANLPLIAVGPGTAQLAREIGFEDVITGAGTGAGLVPIIQKRAGTFAGTLVQIRGEEVAFDLKGALAARGVDLREVLAYRTVPATALKPETIRLLADGAIEAVILMSPRTATIFAHLITVARLRGAGHDLTLICLSPAVAAATEPIGAKRVVLADRPDREGMLSTVTRVATLWSGV
jgi:uroporphyrinogen-III synthase